VEPPAPHPTRKLAAENERLRLQIEALERLAAESRLAEEARRESEERFRRGADERRLHEAEVLGRVTSEINASLNLDTVLERVGEGARQLCGGDVAGVALREAGSDAMVFRFWSDVRGTHEGPALRGEPGTGLAARVLETRRAVRLGRHAAGPPIGPDDGDVAGSATVVAVMAVPILLGSQVEGIIYVGNRTARFFTEGDETSVQRLADHAVVAIQNARQFRGHVRRQEELAVLYEVTRLVTGDLEGAALVGALHPLLGRLLDAGRLLALAWNPADRGFDLLLASGGGWTPDDAGLEVRVVEREQPIRTINYLATCAAEGRTPSPHAHGLRYSLTVPVRATGRVLGTLSFWSGERPYSRADEEFAAAVGALLALRLTRPSAR
jgi:GAF domain-containing protein